MVFDVILESHLEPYLPAGIYLILLLAVGLFLVNASRIFGPRRPDHVKASPYECGVPLRGSPREKFSVKFYLVAILFVLFDIETVFLIPWAVVYRRFGVPGILEMILFLGVLTVGLLYAWRRGGLEWD